MAFSHSQFSRNQTAKIVAAFAAIYIIWGTTYLGIRIAVETIPAFFMAGVRFLIAGLLALAFLRLRGVPIPTWPQWRGAAVVGAFLVVGGNGLVTWSEQQVPSSIAALVVATVPLWMTLLDWLLYGGRKPGIRSAIGLAMGFVGIGLLVTPGQLLGSMDVDWISVAVLVMAPVLWSVGSLQSRRATLPDNVFMSTAVEMLVGGGILLVAGLLTGEASRLDIAAITPASLWATLYLTFFGSIVALTAYVWLLKTVQASTVATYTYVNPVIAVFLGWLVLSEPLTTQMLLAVAIIVSSVLIITGRRRRSRAQTAPALPPDTLSCEAGAAGD